jgi:uncharacterized membrane protein YdjX (TVP38/TMEM64 family)
VLVFIFQKTGFFDLVKSSEGLQQYLEKAGIWMPILYIALQFLQVIILPIPSIVSTIAGVALFGALKAMIYSFIGIMLGSLLAFFIGRKLGNKAVAWILGKENLKRWQKKLKGKDVLFLSLMFLLPLFPDDVLCFLAGVSAMTWRTFIIVILLSRAIALVSTCFSVDFIPFTTWWGMAIWGVLAVSFMLIFIFFNRNFEKINQKINILKSKRKKRK